MCVIIVMEAYAVIDYDKLKNAVHNNWHSWGLVTIDDDQKIKMEKGCPEKETDPEVIKKLLEDNVDKQRFLHLRYATRGTIDEENAQPFQVVKTDEEEIFFMHNGTLSSKFGLSEFQAKQKNVPELSDTKDFAERILSKSLPRWIGAGGELHDYLDKDFYDVVIEPNWTDSSKGILISNKRRYMIWGPTHNGWRAYNPPGWKEGDAEVWVSNNDYFDSVVRGPEKERRAEAERLARLEEGNSGAPFRHNNVSRGPWRSGDTTDGQIMVYNAELMGKDPTVVAHLKNIWKDQDLETPAGLRGFAFVTQEEWEDFLSKEDSLAASYLMVQLFSQYAEWYDFAEERERKMERMQKRMDWMRERMKEKGIEEEEAA